MVPKVVLPAKGLAANLTRKRPLVSVGPFVDEQVVALGELPLAVGADELLLLPATVTAQPC